MHATKKLIAFAITVAMLLSCFSFVGSFAVTTNDDSANILEESKESLIDANTRLQIMVEAPGTPALMKTKSVEKAAKIAEKNLAKLPAQVSKVETQLGQKIEVDDYFALLFNGFCFEGEYWMIEKINEMSGFKAYEAPTFEAEEVEYDDDLTVSPNTGTSTGTIGAQEAWESGYSGEGTVIAIIDTGLDMDHEAFSVEPANGKIDAEYVENVVNEYGSLLHCGLDASDLYKSGKVVFAWDYFDNDSDPNHTFSYHGSHVAGIAAGNNGSTFKGTAPDAQLAIFQVFTSGGAGPYSNIVKAMEDAVYLGVDSINMSLGSPCGFSNPFAYISGLEDAFNALRNAGISVECSAGNDYYAMYLFSAFDGIRSGLYATMSTNPDYGVVGMPACIPDSFCVGSAKNTDINVGYLVVDGTEYYYSCSTNAPGLINIPGEHEFVYCGLGSAEEFAQIDVEGKIAFIKRGTVTFTDKIANATAAGAAGIILYNNTAGMLNLTLSSTIPFGLMSGADGDLLADGLELGESFTGEIVDGAAYMSLTPASSSSWGTTSDLLMKPEICAPGESINSADGSGGYVIMSGTSMASPHIAGAINIIKQYLRTQFPDATDSEINELAYTFAMNTANQINGFVRQQGAGLIDISKAISTDVYITVPGSDRPKFEDMESETGEFVFNFEIKNFGETDRSYSIDVKALCESVTTDVYTGSWRDGFSYPETEVQLINGSIKDVSGNVISDAPETICVPAGETVTLTITIAADEDLLAYYDEYMPVGGMFEGWVKFIALDEDGVNLSVPFLGYIGDWDEPSMLDRGYYWQVATGEASLQANGTVRYNTVGFGVEQGLGLNRYWDMTGETYLADRNAVSPNGDGIYDAVDTFQYSLLRNSVLTTVTIEDLEGNVIDEIQSFALDSKDYMQSTEYGSGYSWHDIYVDYDWDSLEEDETVNLVLTHYLDHEGYDPYENETGRWVVPVTKDTTAPSVIATTHGFEVIDNNYIAYVAVYNDAELTDLVFEDGVFAETRGEVYWHQVNSNHYYVTVADYAGNEAVYEVEDGLVFATSESFFNHGRTMIGYATENYATGYYEDGWVSFKTGAMAGVTVLTEPENVSPIENTFFGADYKYQDAAVTREGFVYCVDEDGNLDMVDPDSFYAVEVWSATTEIIIKNISYDKYSDRLLVVVNTYRYPDVSNGTHLAFLDPDTGELEFTGFDRIRQWGFEVIAENTIACFTSPKYLKLYTFDGTLLQTYEIPCCKPGEDAYSHIGTKGYTADMVYDETENCIYISGHWSWLGYSMFTTGGMFKFDLDTNAFTIHRVGANTGRVVQAIFFEDQLCHDVIELEDFDLSVDELDMHLCDEAVINFIRIPSNANHYTLEWTSSNEDVVTVSGNKFMANVNAAMVEGYATITCSVYVDDELFDSKDVLVYVHRDEDLNEALNVEYGELIFVSTNPYAFITDEDGERFYAKSGNTGVNESDSFFFTTIDMIAGETLEFDYLVSSEIDYDYFTFSVNGEELLAVADIMEDWGHFVFTAPEDGEYSFVWNFNKDANSSDGFDGVLIDEVAYSGDVDILGDVDGDGFVTMADAVIVARHAMGIITLSDEAFALADIDGDGFVTMLDAVLIMRLVAIQD
ncbi:MAG: S8 family serine peptidase [Christensenellales bacterium]